MADPDFIAIPTCALARIIIFWYALRVHIVLSIIQLNVVSVQALKGYYTKESCPLFLTPSGFETLRADNGRVMDSFRLHTDSILK